MVAEHVVPMTSGMAGEAAGANFSCRRKLVPERRACCAEHPRGAMEP